MSALQPCPICLNDPCCGDDPFTFSLVNGTVYANDQVAIDFECPPGFRCVPGVYVIPAGRFTLVIPSNQASTLRMQCCQSEIVQSIPAGATNEEIGVIAQQMVNACALQQANCNANATVESSFNHGFNNAKICMTGCPAGKLLGYTGAAPSLGKGLTFELGFLCVAANTFTSTSVAAANARARDFLASRISFFLGNGTLQCGYWNTEQECP